MDDDLPRNSWRRLPVPVPGHLETATTFFLWLAVGCSPADGLNRQAMSGTVTVDGQPLASGAILFEPQTERSGTAVGATIRHGRFVISRDQGAVPGTYRVRVYASSGKQALPTKGQTERTPRPMVERLPARYNAQTELRAEVIVRRDNKYVFDLSSSESPDAR
jgi:hypothetical protein